MFAHLCSGVGNFATHCLVVGFEIQREIVELMDEYGVSVPGFFSTGRVFPYPVREYCNIDLQLFDVCGRQVSLYEICQSQLKK